MPHKDGWKVWIEVDKVKLDEHQERVEKGNESDRVSCFIASQIGKNFTVQVENTSDIMNSPEMRMSIQIHVDGTKRRASRRRERLYSCNAARISYSTERPFVFSKLNFEEEGGPTDYELKEMSTIRVRVLYCRDDTRSGRTCRAAYYAQAPVTSISEKAKKGGEHCISLGPTKQTRAAHTSPTKHLPELGVIDFIFNYASREFLQARSIIAPPTRKVLDEDSDDDPVLVRSSRKRNVKAEGASKSREELSSEDDAVTPKTLQIKRRRVSVKQEKGVTSEKRLFSESVIDLTGD